MKRCAGTILTVWLALAPAMEALAADEGAAVKAAANDPVALPISRRNAEPTKPAVAVEPAESEKRSLGAPVGAFSLPDKAARTDEKAGLLDAIDPRASSLPRVLLSLLVVVGLILLLAKIAKRMQGGLGSAGQPSGVLDVLAKYPVARGQQLMLIKLDRRVLLVHRGGTSMTTLAEVREAEEVASLLARVEAGKRESLGEKFQSLLERFNSEHDSMRSTLSRDLSSGGASAVETIDLTRPRARSRGGKAGR